MEKVKNFIKKHSNTIFISTITTAASIIVLSVFVKMSEQNEKIIAKINEQTDFSHINDKLNEIKKALKPETPYMRDYTGIIDGD